MGLLNKNLSLTKYYHCYFEIVRPLIIYSKADTRFSSCKSFYSSGFIFSECVDLSVSGAFSSSDDFEFARGLDLFIEDEDCG